MNGIPAAKKLVIVDSTLRDGAQAPGVVMSYPQRAEIAELLIEIGINEIEAGIPAMGGQEIKFLSFLNTVHSQNHIIGWCRATDSDLNDAKRARCRNVHIAFPVSDIQLKAMDKDRHWLFNTLERIVGIARKKFEFVSVGAMDASRSDTGVLRHFCKTAALVCVDRIRIADTVGILTPSKTIQLFSSIAEVVDLAKVEFHGHNDLGMATANAFCAAEIGVGAISVTVNGIGERAGNTALEEIAVAVKTNKIPMQPLKLSKIQELCDRVSLLTNSTISDSKPITGKSVFLHESGIHWNALLKNKHAFEAFPPSITGHARSVPVAGTHSGGATVRAILGKNRMKISDTDSRRVAASIRKKVHRIGRVLTTREVENLCERHLS